MITTDTQLSGLQKASVLLMSLDAEVSQAVMDRLSPQEREILGAQIVNMRSVKSVVRDQVLQEVSTAVTTIKQSETQPFVWLEKRLPSEVAQLIANERPHTIALVISHLSSKFAALVLARLDEPARDKVVKSLSGLTKASAETVAAVDGLLRQRLQQPASNSIQLSSLDDLLALPGNQIKALLGEVNIEDLSLALRVAAEDLVEAVLGNVPATTAQLIRDGLNSAAQVRIREIEAAQDRVLKSLNQAQASGGRQ
ncbi:MAG: FliG C-terminal domain-containing protein [Armatimonadota bacterium]